MLSNVRCSGHELLIEKGRHMKIVYKYCYFILKRNVNVIEDEFHFILVCPLYDEIRLKYKMDIIGNHYNFKSVLYNDVVI